MSRAIQIRRGTADEHSNFTGLLAEVTFDTTNKTLRVHDGETPGGFSLARADAETNLGGADYVIETFRADDGSSWYRKYKSGWVEQGGVLDTTVVFSIPMCDALYCITVSNTSGTYENFRYYERTTTGFKYKNTANSSAPAGTWRVCGFAG